MQAILLLSLERETGVGVGGEDFLDRVGVRGCPQVQAQVELDGSLHDSLQNM